MTTLPREALPESPDEAVVLENPKTRAELIRRTIARVLSSTVHPLLFPLLAIGVVADSFTHSAGRALLLTTLTALFTSVPVAALVWVQVKRGAWSDLDVSRRRQRYLLYPFTLALLGALTYLYARLNAPYAVRAVLALAIANVIDALINLRWKVSAHATTAAACAALLWYFVPGPIGPIAAACALAVGWSRVELHRHTPGQVGAGWLVGTASSLFAGSIWR